MVASAHGHPALGRPRGPEKDDPTIWRVDDALWALLAPILASDKPRKKPGRPRRDDRAIFDGLIWLARTGSQWSQLPREFGPKSTVHERFTEWVATGALERAWAVLLPSTTGRSAWTGPGRRPTGASSRPRSAKRGAGEAEATGRNPTDRGKPGTKRHLLTEAKGIPVAVVLTGANRHDMKKLAALLDATVVEPAPRSRRTWSWTGATTTTTAGTRPSPAATRRTSRPRRARRARCRRPATRTATRRGAGWWRWRTAGSTASAAC